MILAAGEGTRLRPLTLKTPKALIPIGGISLVEHTLCWLRTHGIDEVAINLYHLGNKIVDSLGDGSQFGIKIHYSQEERLLGSAGGVKKMEHIFDSTFVIVYGDVLTYFDLTSMIRFHKQKKSMVTMVLSSVSNPWEKGIVQLNDDGKILNFVEKPANELGLGNLANGGIYVIEREIVDHIPANCTCDFGHDILPTIMELGMPMYGYVLKNTGYLLDIGNLQNYEQANRDVDMDSRLTILSRQ